MFPEQAYVRKKIVLSRKLTKTNKHPVVRVLVC